MNPAELVIVSLFLTAGERSRLMPCSTDPSTATGGTRPKHLLGTCSKDGPRSPRQVSAMPEGFGGMCLVSLTTENESSPNKQPRGPTAHICADTQKITVRSRLFFLPSTYQCLYWREQTLMFPAINPFSPLPKRVSSTMLTAPTPPFTHQTRSRGESRQHLQGRSKREV